MMGKSIIGLIVGTTSMEKNARYVILGMAVQIVYRKKENGIVLKIDGMKEKGKTVITTIMSKKKEILVGGYSESIDA